MWPSGAAGTASVRVSRASGSAAMGISLLSASSLSFANTERIWGKVVVAVFWAWSRGGAQAESPSLRGWRCKVLPLMACLMLMDIRHRPWGEAGDRRNIAHLLSTFYHIDRHGLHAPPEQEHVCVSHHRARAFPMRGHASCAHAEHACARSIRSNTCLGWDTSPIARRSLWHV